jgi:hypothetical protein
MLASASNVPRLEMYFNFCIYFFFVVVSAVAGTVAEP